MKMNSKWCTNEKHDLHVSLNLNNIIGWIRVIVWFASFNVYYNFFFLNLNLLTFFSHSVLNNFTSLPGCILFVIVSISQGHLQKEIFPALNKTLLKSPLWRKNIHRTWSFLVTLARDYSHFFSPWQVRMVLAHLISSKACINEYSNLSRRKW